MRLNRICILDGCFYWRINNEQSDLIMNSEKMLILSIVILVVLTMSAILYIKALQEKRRQEKHQRETQ